MHALATRLGLRDGQAYTVVAGALVALLLGAVGLPPVLRGVEVPRIEQAVADRSVRSSPGTTVAVREGVDRRPTPSISPGVATPPTSRPGSTPSRPQALPAGDAAPPTSVPPPRAVGDLRVVADIGPPGAPDDVALAADGTVYVTSDSATRGPGRLLAFAADGTRRGSWAAPDQPDDRERGLTGVAVTGDGTVLVADAATGRVLRLAGSSSSLVPVATIPDLAACGLTGATDCEPGLVDRSPLLTDLAVALDGTVVVADHDQGIVWALVEGAEPEIFVPITDRSPVGGPIAVSFERNGQLLVAVSGRLSSLPPGLPAVFRVPVEDGDAGDPELLVDLADGEVPGDAVASRTDRLYVTIPSTGVIADIGIDQGDRIDLAATDDGYEAPTGAALGDRALLLTDPSDFGGRGSFGRLLALTVNDRPVPRGAS